MKDNKIVKIQQDSHYTHNDNNEPVFTIAFKRSNGSRSHSIEHTVPELIAIKDAIITFLDSNHTEGKENDVFEEWYREYFCDYPRPRAFTAWSRLIWLLYSGTFIPEKVYHPNQTLNDDD